MVNQSKIRVIVPFAAKSTVSDWETSCRLLKRTINSVLALPTEFASVSVIGHDFPGNITFGDRCEWVAIEGIPPNKLDSEAKKSDKGAKLLLGVKKAYTDGHEWVMFVDADDLINRDLPLYCELDQYDAVCFENGYSWNEKSHLLLKIPNFHRVCGTSWIMRLTPQMFPIWLGEGGNRVCDIAHNSRFEMLTRANSRIKKITTPMAMYSVGQESAMGFSEMMGLSLTPNFSNIKNLAKLILRYRPLTPRVRESFGL
jgi:hypothetical protein